RKGKDQGGDGVDLRRDAPPQSRPDFERQRIVAADQKKAYGNFIEREGEDQQRRADDRKAQVRDRHAPEGLPIVRSEIERGFLLGSIEHLQAGEDFRGGHRDQGRAVSQGDGDETQLLTGGDEQHQQRQSRDDAGKNQRQ